MKKLLLSAMLLALFLTACIQPPQPSPVPSPSPAASPIPPSSPESSEEPTELWGFPIDETHDAFEVPTGGKLGTVLVTVEQEQSDSLEPSDFLFAFSVWSADDLTAPIQTMNAESWGSFHGSEVLDLDFDGHMDFRYQRSWGTGGVFRHHWRWDETAEEFAAVPELTEYGMVVPDPETETVRAHVKGLESWDDIYLWEAGVPVCVRRVSWFPRFDLDDSAVIDLTVSDRVNGQLIQVFSGQFPEDEGWSEIHPWYDLSYHG